MNNTGTLIITNVNPSGSLLVYLDGEIKADADVRIANGESYRTELAAGEYEIKALLYTVECSGNRCKHSKTYQGAKTASLSYCDEVSIAF
ncbi:hypothetical protein E1176_01750 [Fulvivirga sp. RKSG066]|nr:hypothetical protein [Fulvivirga aurantia]